MAALDFPSSPTLNQVYSANGRSWIWDGSAWNPYGSGIADGDRGDITVSAGGSQWTVDNDVVTYAKMQNVSAASRVLGRGDSGSGDVQELTVGTGLSITGTTLACTVTDTGITQLTGDVTAGPGNGSQAATIANDAVTNAKLANMAQSTIKGRAAGAGTGDPTDLTATQATAILDNFAGDSGSGGTKGLVPAPASGDAAASKFLKADGTWATTPGGGISDGDKGDITVSGSGATWTIDNDAVTYAKMQNVSAASRLLGRGSASGSGDPEEITLGSGLTMTGTTLSAEGGGSIGGSTGSFSDRILISDGTGGSTVKASLVSINDIGDILTPLRFVGSGLVLKADITEELVTVQASATTEEGLVINLPPNNGSPGQVLSTNGSGTTSWITPESGGGDTAATSFLSAIWS